MRRFLFRWLACGAGLLALAASERINHEGRILGPAPVVAAPVLFNTAQADAIVSAMQIMPVTSAWNENISGRPLLTNSDAMIAQITADLAVNRRALQPFYEMNFVLVPDSQPLVPIAFVDYPDESDPAPYPLPANLPVETWPRGTGSQTLSQWQQNADGSDRHSITVMPGAGFIWETWQTLLSGGHWQASNGAKFPLATNAPRPAGWTSGDAAGLPMFPALVRYDECQRGMVEHALRLVVKRTRLGPIYPATHAASVGGLKDPNIPAMGQRLRLKAAFAIPAAWTKEEKAVLLALKKYGAIVADNGGFFSVSVCPDDRFSATAFGHLSTVGIGNFEVIQTTGPTEGPRSAGAPAVAAGPDRAIAASDAADLSGTITAGGGAVRWTPYSGPGTVTFANPAQSYTSAAFSAPGVYTLMLSVDDGTHAVAYDAAIVTVNAPQPCDTWKAAHFTPAELAAPAVSGDAADPDGDGLSNLLEYALGSDPRVSGPAAAPAAVWQNAGGLMYLGLTFRRRTTATDAACVVEAADDPAGPWDGPPAVQAGPPSDDPGGQTQTWVYRDTLAMSAAARRFLRLRVTRL